MNKKIEIEDSDRLRFKTPIERWGSKERLPKDTLASARWKYRLSLGPPLVSEASLGDFVEKGAGWEVGGARHRCATSQPVTVVKGPRISHEHHGDPTAVRMEGKIEQGQSETTQYDPEKSNAGVEQMRGTLQMPSIMGHDTGPYRRDLPE